MTQVLIRRTRLEAWGKRQQLAQEVKPMPSTDAKEEYGNGTKVDVLNCINCVYYTITSEVFSWAYGEVSQKIGYHSIF